MSRGDNWIKDDTPTSRTREASRVLSKIKRERKGKRFQLVLVCEHPRTFKEIEIPE